MARAVVGTLGARLRGLREAAGLSQEELAARAGLSTHAVSALERGTRTRPYPHTIRVLADALGASDEERAALIAAVPARARTARPVRDAAGPRAGELHVPTTPLLGRDREVARVADLLRDRRMVTLTGTGGVGKTRLALAVAVQVGDRFADGVTFVPLAPLLDADQVLPTVADALGVTIDSDGAAAAVSAHLRDRQVLLVLDNLEHVLRAAPEVAALVEAAPGLVVLTTSRAPLRVRGEVEVAVEPLALPGEGVEDSPAVQLLLARADAVRSAWGTTGDDAGPVAEICTRLAGIPLAIELAAARARALDPPTLLARLDSALLEGGRDLPERQRTMRATLDWSYGLLGPDEQRLLRLLAVFVGGFRLDDLEEVALRAGAAERERVLPVLETLLEQSLVMNHRDPHGGRRYRLLEPVTQYAREQLAAEGEEARAVAAHAQHYLVVAEEIEPHYRSAGQVEALARADVDHPNLTAAVERSLEAGDIETAARVCWSLWMYWWLRGHVAHGRRLSEAVLAHEVPQHVRARAFLAAATTTFALDDLPAARRWWEQAGAEAGDDPVAAANSVAGVGLADLAAGDLASARARFEAARPYAEAGGPDGEWTLALSWVWSGTVALLEGDFDRAVEDVERGLASARARGDRLSAYIALYNLSQVELVRGRHDKARRHLEEGTQLSLETGDLANLAYLLDAAAVLETAEGVHSRVPLLLGAAQGIRESIGTRGYGYYRPDPQARATAEEEARRHLGGDRYDDALDVGRGMTAERAAALVLGPPVAG